MKLQSLLENDILKERRIFAYKLQDAFIEIGGKNTKIKFENAEDIVSALVSLEWKSGTGDPQGLFADETTTATIQYQCHLKLKTEAISSKIIFIKIAESEDAEPLKVSLDIEPNILAEYLLKALIHNLDEFEGFVIDYFENCEPDCSWADRMDILISGWVDDWDGAGQWIGVENQEAVEPIIDWCRESAAPIEEHEDEDNEE